jgi:hypothetical protein
MARGIFGGQQHVSLGHPRFFPACRIVFPLAAEERGQQRHIVILKQRTSPSPDIARLGGTIAAGRSTRGHHPFGSTRCPEERSGSYGVLNVDIKAEREAWSYVP